MPWPTARTRNSRSSWSRATRKGSLPCASRATRVRRRALTREAIRSNPPDILLTNYMMLELLLTRREDRELVRAAQGLRFLVFDELHTYRGRQGADVALLIRRCRLAFGGHDIICIGTSATMASEGTSEEQKREVAKVAQTLFGVPFDASQVIGETLERATPEVDCLRPAGAASAPPDGGSGGAATRRLRDLSPAPSGLLDRVYLRCAAESRRRAGSSGRSRDGCRATTARPRNSRRLTSSDPACCAAVLRRFLLTGSDLRRSASSRFPIFAFRLHQFFTRGDTVWATIEPETERHLEMSKKGSKPGEPDKPLFPLVFCRQCGTAYYRVQVVSDEHGKSPAAPGGPPRGRRRRQRRRLSLPVRVRTLAADRGSGAPGAAAGLHEGNHARGRGTRSLRRATTIFPSRSSSTPSGRLVSEGDGIPAALIRRNFLFCLDPSCGVAYTKSQRSERAKLATLGVDNRSTATTILAVRSLIELQGDQVLEPRGPQAPELHGQPAGRLAPGRALQ